MTTPRRHLHERQDPQGRAGRERNRNLARLALEPLPETVSG